ncbi:hypothetical protein VOLCADRAFT_105593 [Volvox carteri f. nagariensis]|uniref:Sugar phosphate transporter domain-containing protein n=1 Tax=Volvox carteri f. nagariensis TaxID=3068 RepID=D8U1R4_VOLCA|nr:uncharacterized protein VOLCADRAFT_105593 [Volvox carteri f. nagariensis]EFJ46455.1 hypothetical protein VOLCADRAFT_105593 [Volvox carteri f. nagariensis]|eukprot:XP_002952608.1 hypothetical protein VOLCADRAFT_105593 [Volvox carteri f. nagariensis]
MSSVIKPCAAAEEKGSPAAATFKSSGTPQYIKIIYIALNVFAACSIVFANKIVFAVYHFKFVTTLTLIHTLFTWLGMIMMQQLGFFDSKSFTPLEIAPLALGYVGYIVLNNLSLNLNTVGFYQILKIAITPTVIFLEFLLFRKVQSLRVLLAVVVVCVGVAAAAVTDTVAVSNLVGVAVGLGSVVVTALYQIWAGSKQRELRANSSQLLLAYTPQATVLLAVLAPLLDDIGFAHPGPNTVLGYSYRPAAVAAIVVSGLLGLLVSLSTFLVIGATSSLTYNVVGHSKTVKKEEGSVNFAARVLILAGGCLIFGDSMPWKRLLGIAVTMSGIAWTKGTGRGIAYNRQGTLLARRRPIGSGTAGIATPHLKAGERDFRVTSLLHKTALHSSPATEHNRKAESASDPSTAHMSQPSNPLRIRVGERFTIRTYCDQF